MSIYRPAIAIGSSLFILAGASLLDVARMQPQNDKLSASYADNSRKGSYLQCSDTVFLHTCPATRVREATSQRTAEAKRPLLIQVAVTE